MSDEADSPGRARRVRSTAMTYARARLWLGISGVGTVVAVSALLLLFRIPMRTLPTEPSAPTVEVGSLILAVLLYAALQAPFDWFGGWILPTEYRRDRERRARASLPGFLVRWFRGALLHGVVLVAVGLGVLVTARVGGLPLAAGFVVGVSVVLVVFQTRIAQAIGAFRVEAAVESAGAGRDAGGRPVVWIDGAGPYVTGGIAGLPGRAAAVMPAAWRERLTDSERHAQRLRRLAIVASGARTRGLVVALAWNVAGFVGAYALTVGAGPVGVAHVVSLALAATLWSFVGVLVLPSVSRPAVHAADAAALETGADRDSMTGLIRALDVDQDDEPARDPRIQAIFHPIPSVESRIAALDLERNRGYAERPFTAWHAARTALYLSWATLGLLGRAVHCNSGRPDAWVFLPSD